MAKKPEPALDIKRGDTVRIHCQGLTREGVVESASNYGNLPWSPEPCWYIEYEDPIHGIGYWKQDNDGGTVKLIKKG